MPIRWSSILSGSWEIALNQTLVRRPLGMEGGSVSVAVPLSSPPLVFYPILVGESETGRARVEYRLWPYVHFPACSCFLPKRLKTLIPLLCCSLDRSGDKPCAIIDVARLLHGVGRVQCREIR